MKIQKTRKDIHSDQSTELNQEEIVIPVIGEVPVIKKKIVKKGSVQVKKEVFTEEVSVETPLTTEQIDIQRIKLNRYLDNRPEIRYEGDTLVIPVLQEVIEKRLLLVEEIRITKHSTTENWSEKTLLTREKVSITGMDK